MSLHVDTDALQNQTLPALNKSKENLSSAREIISSIDIPSDFRGSLPLTLYVTCKNDSTLSFKNISRTVIIY